MATTRRLAAAPSRPGPANSPTSLAAAGPLSSMWVRPSAVIAAVTVRSGISWTYSPVTTFDRWSGSTAYGW
ncbi:hypothetical protein DMH18_36270 [Streptomyces sp. WAC 06783]|uniref:hypothetical protein n=1 Tax=Streptomyces sp. WAC 06783 TaxID=2203211 RepID=UPI000F7416E1|nr:hypothetical protein [Streptomyces sp. WAC 06783]RSO03838.1 hypothetical protein DMH18_36270 [Streptomyces sp. WAC 06783]